MAGKKHSEKPESILSSEDLNWIRRTIKERVEQEFQAHERGLDQTIEEIITEKMSANPRPHGIPHLKFTEQDKKDILALIDRAAKQAAMEEDERTHQVTLNDFKYKQALPSKDELDHFLWVCEQKALDPRANQIYFQKRGGRCVHLVAIDSYRLMAQRAGDYRAGSRPTEFYDANHKLYYGETPHHCVTFCNKRDIDGQWGEIAQIAFFDEYKQTYGRGQNAKLNSMWQKMGRSQLEKCCESKMLRKGWPSELGGIYTREEMEQADSGGAAPASTGTVDEDLKNLTKGEPNKGHEHEGFKRKPANQPRAAEIDMNAKCAQCAGFNQGQDQHPRASHDGESALGPCMAEGCECPGYSEHPAKAFITRNYETNVAKANEEPKIKIMVLCVGTVTEFTDVKKSGTGREYVQIKVYGLPEDKKNDPHHHFFCYHKSQFDVLRMSAGERIEFVYEPELDKSGKPSAEGIVWQQIHHVERMGLRKYVDGKPVEEVTAEPQSLDAEEVLGPVKPAEQPAAAVDDNPEAHGMPGLFEEGAKKKGKKK